MPPTDNSWFDKKYRNGEKPTLRDRAALFGQLDIRLSDRTKRKLEEQLNDALYNFGRNYSPSNHALAYGLLFCLTPLIGLEEKVYLQHVAKYNKILEKHKGKIVFNCNFDPDETRTPQP